MAWADTTAYTAPEKAAAKTDLDEVSSLITAKVTKTNTVSGKLTVEEQALLVIKALVDARSATLV